MSEYKTSDIPVKSLKRSLKWYNFELPSIIRSWDIKVESLKFPWKKGITTKFWTAISSALIELESSFLCHSVSFSKIYNWLKFKENRRWSMTNLWLNWHGMTHIHYFLKFSRIKFWFLKIKCGAYSFFSMLFSMVYLDFLYNC